MGTEQDDHFVVTGGETVWIGTIGVRFLLDSANTGGALSIVEHPVPPGGWAGPMHTHANEDEYSVIADGTFGFRIGDRDVTAEAGSVVCKPRGIPHTFWNAGDAEGRILEVITPGGFEGYFREAAPHFPQAGPPDLEALGALWQRYGLTMDLASMEELAETHGLAIPGT